MKLTRIFMKLSDGLFLESARTVAADYEGRVEFEDRIVDNMSSNRRAPFWSRFSHVKFRKRFGSSVRVCAPRNCCMKA